MDGDRLSLGIHSISQWMLEKWSFPSAGSKHPATAAVSRTISHLVLRASPGETNDLSHVIDHLPMGHLSFLPPPISAAIPPTNAADIPGSVHQLKYRFYQNCPFPFQGSSLLMMVPSQQCWPLFNCIVPETPYYSVCGDNISQSQPNQHQKTLRPQSSEGKLLSLSLFKSKPHGDVKRSVSLRICKQPPRGKLLSIVKFTRTEKNIRNGTQTSIVCG
ncbi:uncharacterized protein CDAR_180481 [Caerostris darwini]|uniref:Uncharacterized protein n=1 Tax=Caerostris darwini TaxID=1538125 RepID=A0AAV4NPC7_9ARAC|nr:uncharacterized protein CDAR_180481 [Caerostris darwini]